MIVDTLKNKYPLLILLKYLNLARSSYYYQHKIALMQDKYGSLRYRVETLFSKISRRYGYRQIHGLLVREGLRISEKVIRRIMKESHLLVITKHRKKYSSYRGEITPSVPNIIERNFHADTPNKKWLADITEFAIPAGKVYLSHIVGCFDGLLPYW